ADKRITAYHESGHAILARLLTHCDPVQEVSIIPRGMAAGYTMTRPDNDNNHLSRNKLLDDIVMTLGGRVAEELIIGDISSGASNDISVVTERARKMVAEWGMSDKIGPVNYGDNDQLFIGRDMQTRSSYSETVATTIDEEVEKIIKEAHSKATELLTANKQLLHNMARLLIEKETIYQDEVDMIMEGKEVKEIISYMEGKENERRENPFKRSSGTSNEKTQSVPKDEIKEPFEDDLPEMPTVKGDDEQ
ncbi:MAG: cell division protein FtsH, partial [Clostridia bacterium]|nr:cell division protein FtsH [Clostridia bacterium]